LENLGAAMSDSTQSEIDVREFVDPNIQGIQIWRFAGDDPGKIATFQAELLAEQVGGWCKILFMDDQLAIVQWLEEFVLTLNEEHPIVAASIPEVP
jgi:hypothetical protein